MKAVFFADELRARQGSQHFLARCVISSSQAQGSRNDDDQGLHFVVWGAPSAPVCFPGLSQELSVCLPAFHVLQLY